MILIVVIFYIFQLISAQVDKDPSCKTLMDEFRVICFAPPSKGAIDETLAFCKAYRDSCKNTVASISIPKPKDLAKYCEKHRERFRYVCPDPTRFGKYSAVAMEFCPRYQNFCPKEELPTKPEMFTEKYSKHIYIREHQYFCDLYDDWAKVYCFNPRILRVPRYQIQCYFYKIHCIDPQTQVLYAVGK